MASASVDNKWQKDAADQNFDYMFKLLIIGNSSVGKTSFLFRYADDSFTSAFVSTVGIDFKVKTVFRQDKRVKLQIWVSQNLSLWFKFCLHRSGHIMGYLYFILVIVFFFFLCFQSYMVGDASKCSYFHRSSPSLHFQRVSNLETLEMFYFLVAGQHSSSFIVVSLLNLVMHAIHAALRYVWRGCLGPPWQGLIIWTLGDVHPYWHSIKLLHADVGLRCI